MLNLSISPDVRPAHSCACLRYSWQLEMRHIIPVVVLTIAELSQNDRERLTGYVETIMTKGEHSLDEMMEEIIHALPHDSVHEKAHTTLWRNNERLVLNER